MISLQDYFGGKPHSDEQAAAARHLLERVKIVLLCAQQESIYTPAHDPDTSSCISGAKGGSGDGGFRTPASTTGAANSAHREARAVDIYDPGDYLDSYLDKFEDGKGGNSVLALYGLYREHPSATPGWCHLQTRAPGSGRRTFYP